MKNQKRHNFISAVLVMATFALAALPGCKTTLQEGGPYAGDTLLYRAELASVSSYDLMNLFVKWEYDNRELLSKHPEIKAFDQPVNQGQGAAIRRAVQEMTGQYAIIQDADLEYDPNDYMVVLKPLVEGLADAVYGSRFATREMRRIVHYHHKLGNLFLTHLSNFMTGLDLTDMETCYKAFRTDLLKTIPLRSNRFGIEPEITAKLARRKAVIYEVPISYHGRAYTDGKKIGWRDGVSAIWTILKYAFVDDSEFILENFQENQEI